MENESPLLECISAEELARDQCWWEIYDKSFPAEEREPAEIIVRGVDLGVALASRISLHERTVGIGSGHLLLRSDAVFLVYLAISPEQRGHGLGTKLFEFTWKAAMEHQTRRHRPPQGMIWEVDSPDLAASLAEARLRERRIRFFQRNGGVLLPQGYIQPPVSGVAVPMRLMFRGQSGAPMPDGVDIRKIIKAMYFEKYAELNGIPAEILSQLLRLQDTGISYTPLA